MNDDTARQGESGEIETIRREIDGVDQTLLSLFAQRLQLADKLAGVKGPQAGPPIRPGREVTMLRKLLAMAPAPLEKELVVELWRALVGATLRRQRVVDIAVGAGRTDPTRLFDSARRHFGARVRIRDAGEPQAAMQKAAESPDTVVAVTTWPTAPGVGAWWPALSERRFASLHLIAGLPLLGPTGEDPEAAVWAACPTEEAGGDVSVLIGSDPHHRLQRALGEVGLSGREMARAEPKVMIRVDAYLALGDPRAGALTQAGLRDVRVLGSYARLP